MARHSFFRHGRSILLLLLGPVLCCFYLMSANSEEESSESKQTYVPGPQYEGPHTMLFLGGDIPGKSSFTHPLLPAASEQEKQWDDYRILSAREGDFLKVLVRCIHPYQPREDYWHLYIPHTEDLQGMPARYLGNGEQHGVRFANGMEFYDKTPPPDAVDIGTEEWRYQMRWRRLWKDYYLVAVYRGQSSVVDEWLVRKRDGKNIISVLGENNLNDTASSIRASWLGNRIKISYEEEIYLLLPMRQEDMPLLPPDFPRHLLRGWQ